eukprot:6932674-Pyramimonas_sp.AAC.1
MHRRVRALAHVPDHVPMTMHIRVPASKLDPILSPKLWGWGVLAHGLQQGARREALTTAVAKGLEGRSASNGARGSVPYPPEC